MSIQRASPVSMGQEKLLLWRGMEGRLAVYLSSFSALSAEDREDVLQATLIAFWAKGPDGGAYARPWLYRVARNAAIDMQRKRSWAPRPKRAESAAPWPPEAWEAEEIPDPSPGPEETALSAEETAFVRAFLSGLSDRDRELAFLAFSEGLSYERIAALCATPLGTVKWRLAGIKKRLARDYGRIMA